MVLVIDNFRLANRFMVGGEIQRLVVVEDSNFSLGVLANGHPSFAQAVTRAFGLDLVNDLFELHGQVLGNGAGLLVSEDQGQVFGWQHRPVGIVACCAAQRRNAD